MTGMTIYLGNKNYSSWSLRPWLALKQTSADFAEVVVPLNQAGTAERIKRESPSGRVPALRDGALVVWESLAICEYLAERFPAAGLWPEDPAARAHARAVSNEMHAGFAELRRLLPMDLARRWPLGKRLARVKDDVARVTEIWRTCREAFGRNGVSGAGDFLFGGFTIADAMFAPVVTRFMTYGVPLDPVSAAYVKAVSRWPAMQEWSAAAKAEPWVIRYDVNETPA